MHVHKKFSIIFKNTNSRSPLCTVAECLAYFHRKYWCRLLLNYAKRNDDADVKVKFNTVLKQKHQSVRGYMCVILHKYNM